VQLGDGQQAVVICDGANYGDGLVGIGLLCALGGDFAGDAGDGHGRAVDAGHEEAFEDNFVEVGVGSAGKEAVQLHQELEVDIVALGRLSVARLDVMAIEVDTCREMSIRAQRQVY